MKTWLKGGIISSGILLIYILYRIINLSFFSNSNLSLSIESNLITIIILIITFIIGSIFGLTISSSLDKKNNIEPESKKGSAIIKIIILYLIILALLGALVKLMGIGYIGILAYGLLIILPVSSICFFIYGIINFGSPESRKNAIISLIVGAVFLILTIVSIILAIISGGIG